MRARRTGTLSAGAKILLILFPIAAAFLALGIGLLLVREHIRLPERLRPAAYTALGLVILIFGKYGIGYDAGAFIYNQF